MSAAALQLTAVGSNGKAITSMTILVPTVGLLITSETKGVGTANCTVHVPNGNASSTYQTWQVTETVSALKSAINSDAVTDLSVVGTFQVSGVSTFGGALIKKITTGAAINATATATAAQIATGLITSTSAAATVITLPTGTLLGTQLGAGRGTSFDVIIDNTLGANTVTVSVAVNGILSAAAAANAASQGLLTVPSGVTGLATFRLQFASATAYTITRIA